MPPRGATLRVILIPVFDIEVCGGGGVEQMEGQGSGTSKSGR